MYLSGKAKIAGSNRAHYVPELIMLPVLILTATVVCMKLQVGLSHVKGLQKVVHHANNGVCPLFQFVQPHQ